MKALESVGRKSLNTSELPNSFEPLDMYTTTCFKSFGKKENFLYQITKLKTGLKKPTFS